MFLVLLIAYLPKTRKGNITFQRVGDIEPENLQMEDDEDSSKLAVFSLFNFMKCFPSLARKYY